LSTKRGLLLDMASNTQTELSKRHEAECHGRRQILDR
jgi:hypothetical protein